MADRRSVLLGLGAAALTGCAAPGSAVYQVIDAYRALDRAKAEYPVTRAQIDAQPLGVLGVQVEDGLKGLMIWEKREAGLDYWRSGNNVALVTAGGRILRSQGFPHDQLDSQLVEGAEPIGAPMDRAHQYATSRSIRLAAEQEAITGNHLLQFEGEAEISVLGEKVRVDAWRETIRVSRRERPRKQLFQVDQASGLVVRSIQHIGPELRVILELLKAPSKTA